MDIQDKDEIIKLIREELKRVSTQEFLLPNVVKSRHVGEGVRFIRAGLAANRPTTPEKDGATYYATDENKLYVGDGGAWVSATLT